MGAEPILRGRIIPAAAVEEGGGTGRLTRKEAGMKATRSLATCVGLDGPITGPNAGPAAAAPKELAVDKGGGKDETLERGRAVPGGGMFGPIMADGGEPGPRGPAPPRWCST